VGIASAFTAGMGYEALNDPQPKSSKLKQIGRFSWLLRLL
jgi:hypothetical protein